MSFSFFHRVIVGGCLLSTTTVIAQMDCNSGSCRLPLPGENVSSYSVCCPVANAKVSMIQQAPRLSSFAGKTIAIVGGSFRASVTHPELKKMILGEAPDARVLVLGEIGSAGV